jgi:uncharacterized protein YkwD
MLAGHRKAREAFLLAVNPALGAMREFRLSRQESSVGSDESNDLVVRGATISRRHALIRRRRSRWQIIDNGSTNGTYVGDQKAIVWITLRDGAEVRFGGARFVFRLGNASGARTISDFPVRRRSSGLRMVVVLVVTGLVSGFAVTQYFLYHSYQRENALFRSAPTVQGQAQPRLKSKGVSESSNHLPAVRAAHSSLWLKRVNYWRGIAGLAAVSGVAKLSAAAEEHSRYLVKHALEGKVDALAAGGAHTEEPSDPWYTPTGLAAAQNGDVAPPCEGCLLLSASQHIDDFLAIPFHRMPILDPQITEIGYGSYTERGLQAAMLYLPVPPEAETTFKQPIEFPPGGSSVGFATYQPGSEWPDPLSSCPGYVAPTGIPITLELGRWLIAEVSSYSVKAGNQTFESCVFNASTYNNPSEDAQTRARDILKAYGAIVLIPRQPLASSQTYTVSISANGKTYSWSFSVE